MNKFILLLIAPFFLQSQCNDGEYEILFETYSGEWAGEITWSIIDNNGDDNTGASKSLEFIKNLISD